MTTTATTEAVVPAGLTLSRTRVNAMRAGYLLMGLGLAVAKWPLLPTVSSMPLYESVTLCMLVALSLLALLGLAHPVRLLPVLLFESTWKVLWLSLVAAPQVLSGENLDDATAQVAVNCSLVVVILAVVPWRYVWHRFVRVPRRGRWS